MSAVINKKGVTIEGLSPDGQHPLQVAWEQEDVPQCGHCQSRQIMSAAVLLNKKTDPSDEDITKAMSGNCVVVVLTSAFITLSGKLH